MRQRMDGWCRFSLRLCLPRSTCERREQGGFEVDGFFPCGAGPSVHCARIVGGIAARRSRLRLHSEISGGAEGHHRHSGDLPCAAHVGRTESQVPHRGLEPSWRRRNQFRRSVYPHLCLGARRTPHHVEAPLATPGHRFLSRPALVIWSLTVDVFRDSHHLSHSGVSLLLARTHRLVCASVLGSALQRDQRRNMPCGATNTVRRQTTSTDHTGSATLADIAVWQDMWWQMGRSTPAACRCRGWYRKMWYEDVRSQDAWESIEFSFVAHTQRDSHRPG